MPSLNIFLQLLIIGLTNGAIIALNAVGVTLVYSVVRTINFAHGDLFALTTVLVLLLVTRLNLQPTTAPALLISGLALVISAAVLFALGLNVVIERVAFRPVRGRSRLAPLIATLGISFILYQAALVWRKLLPNWIPGEHRSVPGIPETPRGRIPDLIPALDLAAGLGLDLQFWLKDLLVILLAVGCAVSVALFLRRSRTGKALRAVAQSPEQAQMVGVNLNRATRQTFALGGALAGVAATAYTLYYTGPFGLHGAQSGLLAFTAAVLGGIGSPMGALLSGLLLGVLAALSDYFLAAQWTVVLSQLVLVGLLFLRPTGLTPEERDEDLLAASTSDSLASLDRGRSPGWPRLAVVGLLVLALVYPLADHALGLGREMVLAGIFIFMITALGLNTLLGYAGLLDLGYAASFAIGAYTTAILVDPWGQVGSHLPQPVDFLPALLLALLTSGLFGAFNGLLTVRLRSDYLAIVTLALGSMIYRIALNLGPWTGGVRGLSALPPPTIMGFTFQTTTLRYYLALTLLTLVTLGGLRLIHSRLGRAWMAIGDDEVAAASMGVDVTRARTQAFVLGTATAGLAGALYVTLFSYISPEQVDFLLSAMALAMVVIGGAGNVYGVILGALAVVGYDQLLIPWLGAQMGQLGQAEDSSLWAALDLRELNLLVFGLALYVTTILRARRRPDRG